MTDRTYTTEHPILIGHQGGDAILRMYGCRHCGNAFWTEDDKTRRLHCHDWHPCPHCGIQSQVPSIEGRPCNAATDHRRAGRRLHCQLPAGHNDRHVGPPEENRPGWTWGFTECGRPMRGDTHCNMEQGHKGGCSSVAWTCDGCGKRVRGGAASTHPEAGSFCFMCTPSQATQWRPLHDPRHPEPGDRVGIDGPTPAEQAAEARERERNAGLGAGL